MAEPFFGVPAAKQATDWTRLTNLDHVADETARLSAAAVVVAWTVSGYTLRSLPLQGRSRSILTEIECLRASWRTTLRGNCLDVFVKLSV
ncbi:hypothetical protein C8034_v007278 [Colletotrichum sidae]|uniref:Uncharacterized protein n=1 Tax=Colletotrichum sidae TaxID=1347389 RepID=A0A4R8T471_9PEZI|nr:hypothetical protein C8034_v007278 [Colletotrichum sidae]